MRVKSWGADSTGKLTDAVVSLSREELDLILGDKWLNNSDWSIKDHNVCREFKEYKVLRMVLKERLSLLRSSINDAMDKFL